MALQLAVNDGAGQVHELVRVLENLPLTNRCGRGRPATHERDGLLLSRPRSSKRRASNYYAPRSLSWCVASVEDVVKISPTFAVSIGFGAELRSEWGVLEITRSRSLGQARTMPKLWPTALALKTGSRSTACSSSGIWPRSATTLRHLRPSTDNCAARRVYQGPACALLVSSSPRCRRD